ncbi:Ig domain-containing protein [Thermosulfidibacter takaii]|nr:Ig domain-containing protein [Thermosulfidibacter takaii]
MNKKGFTLVELAIVMVIIGILLGMGLGMLGILTKRAKYKESEEAVNAAVEAVLGYVQEYRKLPNCDTFKSIVRKPYDSFNKPLWYIVNKDLEDCCGVSSNGTIGKYLSIRICKDSTCGNYDEITGVAFMVLSGGSNYNVQADVDGDGSHVSVNGTCVEVNGATTVKVYSPGVQVDAYAGDMNRVEEYDDIAKWVTIPEMQSSTGCQPLHITSPSVLPPAKEGQSYYYQLTSEGGCTPYTWETLDIAPDITLDENGTISGTLNATCEDVLEFDATVTDSKGNNATGHFKIPVEHQPLEIITQFLPYGYVGSPYSATIHASGGVEPYNFTMTGDCPSGLTCSGDTISGTPDNGTEGTYLIKVTVSDQCANTATREYSLVINPAGVGGNTTNNGGGGGGGNGYCLRYTLVNKGGNRTLQYAFSSSCEEFDKNDYVIISFGILRNCVDIYTGNNCQHLEKTVCYHNLIGVDGNNDCEVWYENGDLKDN